MVVPCKECISYAICVANELIICDLLWYGLNRSTTNSYQERFWIAICEMLPNMNRVRWENNPYDAKSRNIYEQSIYQREKR